MRRPVEPSTQLIFLQVAFLSPQLGSWLRGGAHVPPSSRLHSCLVEIFTASHTAAVQRPHQSKNCNFGILPSLLWLFSTLCIFKFSPLCAFKCLWLGRRCGSWKVAAVSWALVKLIQEPRLEPALLLNRKTIRNEKCANCRWLEWR